MYNCDISESDILEWLSFTDEPMMQWDDIDDRPNRQNITRPNIVSSRPTTRSMTQPAKEVEPVTPPPTKTRRPRRRQGDKGYRSRHRHNSTPIIRNGVRYNVHVQSNGVRVYHKDGEAPSKMRGRLAIDGGAKYKLCVGNNNTCLNDASIPTRQGGSTVHACEEHYGKSSSWKIHGHRYRYKHTIQKICKHCSATIGKHFYSAGACHDHLDWP